MTNAESLPGRFEVLTVEQFAEKMMVSRTTVFGWMKTGTIAEGVHYIRLGRVLRFRWGVDLFFPAQPQPVAKMDSQLSPLPFPRSELDSQRGEATVPGPFLTLKRSKAPMMNLDY